jgi:hypothetical protein
MSQNLFNTIVIIDCIPNDELNTARQLRDDLGIIAAAFADGLHVKLIRVENHTDLVNGMDAIHANLKEKGQFPLIHLEGHGLYDENGFALADGSGCSWKQLNDMVTPINVTMGLNLMIVMATCFGGSFSKAIMTIDRAPLWGLLGPVRELSAQQVQVDFTKFYRTFFEAKSASAAIRMLNNGNPQDLYFMTTAQNWFYDVWKNYKAKQCTPEKLEERARAMYRKLKADLVPRIPSIGSLKRCIKSSEEKLFNKYRDTYFMYDLFPGNQDRFPVSYIEAEWYAR